MRSWLERRLAPSRHTTYFEILDALLQDGCPLCHLAVKSLSWYLDMLSYEGINDPGIRARLRAARGFCNEHAWQFAGEIRNAPGRAIIYRDVVNRLLHTVEPAPPSSLPGRLLPAGECPACRSLASSSQRYLGTLILHLGDAELRRRYQGSSGLCLPHLALALGQVRRAEDVGFLIDTPAGRVASLRAASPSGLQGIAAAVTAEVLGERGALPAAQRRVPLELARSRPREGEAGLPTGDGCPVCRAAISAADECLASLPQRVHLLAPATDPPVALALCNAHGWRSLDLAAPGPAAKLWLPAARAVQRVLLAEAQRPHEAPRGGGGLPSALSRGKAPGVGVEAAARLTLARPCVACRAQARREEEACLTLLQSLQAGARVPAQLCLPHLILCLQLEPEARQAQTLVARQIATLKELRAQLDEYIRKQDYRCREPRGDEAGSPWLAMAQVAGEKGLVASLPA